MSQDIKNAIVNYFLVGTGTVTANITVIDQWLSLFVQLISVVSFVIFLLINQDNIQTNWTRFRNRFRKKQDGTKG